MTSIAEKDREENLKQNDLIPILQGVKPFSLLPMARFLHYKLNDPHALTLLRQLWKILQGLSIEGLCIIFIEYTPLY
jgi:hypothetical protein